MKVTESQLGYARIIANTVREPFLVLDEKFRVLAANRSFYRQFRLSGKATENHLIFDIGNGQWNIPKLRRLLDIINSGCESVEDYKIQFSFEPGLNKILLINAHRIVSETEENNMILLSIEDTTECRQAEKLLQIERARFEATLKSIPDEFWIIDAQGNIIERNDSQIQYSLGKSDWPDVKTALQELELLNPDGSRRAPENAALPRALRGETAHKVPEMIRNLKTGELRWREVSSSPIHDEKGNIIGGVAIARDITELKQAEKALKMSELRFREVFCNNMVPMATWKKSGEIIDANDSFLNLIGYNRNELDAAQINWIKITPPEFQEGDMKAVMEFEEKGYCTPYEKMFRHKNGHLIPIIIGIGVFDKHNNIGVLFSIDLSERKRAEEARRESEARLQKTLEVKTVGVLFFRLDGYIHVANATFERMSGYSSEELNKIAHWKTLTAPEFWDITAKSAENIATTGQTPPYEKQMFRKDGSRWWGLFAPTRISGNGLNSECIEFIIDITERKRTDEELRESREMFAAAFRTVQDALIISDIETGLIIDVNQAWISHWGYSREESIGRRSTELGVFTDIADRKRALEIMRKEGRLADFEIRIRTKSGELRDAILYVEQLMLHQKSLMLTIIHDITEHKRAEIALHNRTEELENANRELKSFSYSVSHDLRSPITVIQGFSNILLEDYADKIDEHGRNIINHIITGIDKMSLIIESLLNLGRISRGTIICKRIDLGLIAESVISELKLTEPQRAVQVNIESIIPAHADPKLMTIALTNLIGNAWKYTGKNPDARIDIGFTTEEDTNVYFIRDNGAGFDMKFADKLFQPFQRLHSESEYAGTGVGLAIVQRIIQRHGGRIWAESEIEKGSTFYFTLDCSA